MIWLPTAQSGWVGIYFAVNKRLSICGVRPAGLGSVCMDTQCVREDLLRVCKDCIFRNIELAVTVAIPNYRAGVLVHGFVG